MASATGATAYTFRVEGASNIIRSVRKTPPVHYLFEIESFTPTKTALNGAAREPYIVSTEFGAGGYKWALVIHLNGNKDDHGDGHISLYLRLIDDLDHGCFVDATIKFFIYDYKRKVYLAIQGTGECIYTVMEKEKGFARALPLDDFLGSSNGFLQNGRCMFGAEVFVADVIAKNARLSILNQNTNIIYTWVIEEFSKLGDWGRSDTFIWEGLPWRLEIHPRGWGSTLNSALSLYIRADFTSDFSNGRKFYLELELRIKNLLNLDDAFETYGIWFMRPGDGFGSHHLLSVTDLQNPQKGFKIEDKVIVQAKLNYMMKVDNV